MSDKFPGESPVYDMMKSTTIFNLMATAAMLPIAVAQEPAPAPLPEGVMVTTRAFVNGKEIAPEELKKMVKSVIVRKLSDGSVDLVKSGSCSNPDCTCGPAPKPCECKPGAMCGPKFAPTPAAAPVPPPAPAATPAPETKPDAPTGTMRVFLNGQEVKPTVAVPAAVIKPAVKVGGPTCSRCGKTRVAPRPVPGDMPPCGKARPFGKPMNGTVPPCAHRHAQVIKPAAVEIRRAERPAAVPAPKAESPKAVKVIINGVEAIVPVVPEGVNITIKPL